MSMRDIICGFCVTPYAGKENSRKGVYESYGVVIEISLHLILF